MGGRSRGRSVACCRYTILGPLRNAPMLEVAEALAAVLEHARPRRPEAVALSPVVLGRVLAMHATAVRDSPPFDKSLRDGYAVRSADCAGGAAELRVVEEVPAGAVPAKAVVPWPRVAVLSTGNELVNLADEPGPGQIRNSNGPMLVSLAVRAGAVVHDLGIARDTAGELRGRIEEGLDRTDVLMLAGGVSVGKFDLVPGVLEELGVTPHVRQVRMKPGKPLFFGTRGETLVFGLPGNPVSAFVCFELFVRPALRVLAGHGEPGPRTATLPLAEPVAESNDRPTYR